MREFTPSELDGLLAPVALERARILAPWVATGLAVALLLSGPTGVGLSAPVVGWNLFAIPALTVLAVLLIRRRVSLVWGHHALAIVWWLPTLGTLVSQLYSHDPGLTYLVVVEVAASAVMLERRWVVGSLVALDAVWIPMMIHLGGDQVALHVSLVMAAQIFALLFQSLVRSSLLRAETHRLVHEETSRELAHQLAELRRSEDERAKLFERLVHAQRMEVAGTLSAGLAHDMNNILCSIRNVAELVIADPGASSGITDLAQIVAQAERGAELTRGLLAFSRRGQYRKQVVELDSVLANVVPLLSRTLPKSIEIRQELGASSARIEGDPNQLGQVLINLAVNAAHAMGGTGTLTIRSAQVDVDATDGAQLGIDPGGYVRISVIDTGIGMDETTRLRVFEPFYTTKPLGEGTGLGLSTAWGVVNGHRGAIGVESQLGAGTTFTLHLPVTSEPLPAPPVIRLPPPQVARGTVLVVDDERLVRSSTRRILERQRYTVLEAVNGEDALAVYKLHAAEIGLVILDMGMPVMGGRECFMRLRELSEVPVLVATGYASDGEAQSLLARGASLIEKPYPAGELAREVARILAPS